MGDLEGPDPGLSHADSLLLQREGLIPANLPVLPDEKTGTENENTKDNTKIIKGDGKKD